MTEDNLKEMIKKIAENQEKLLQTKETKEYKLPRPARLSFGKIKKNFITAIIINENRTLDFKKVQIVDGCVELDGVPRMSTTDYVVHYKGKPFIILPSWSIKPFSPQEHYDDTIKNNSTNTGRKLIIAKMKHDQIVPKKSFGGLGWILLILALVGVGYYLFKGGKFF
jgi:hypothetical protein